MAVTTDRRRAGGAVIALDGELDGSNFEQLIDAGRAARDGGARRVVLDLSGPTYIGSSGPVAIPSIALLLRGLEPTSPEDGWQAIHDLSAAPGEGLDGSLTLAGPPPAIERVLDRSGMLGLFAVHPDRTTAVAAAASA